ncbi:DUF3990 domain-containing protein [Clostridium sp. UBA1056]|uniref:DUF3990 domain-containing protein n=1 Tax=unclassified Clostridium TaxID=2614128 RepID=UPI0032180F0F
MEYKNNMNVIYHGSHIVNEKPSIIKDRYTKDFGYGFYCTRNKDEAIAESKIYKTPVVNVYELKDISGLKVKVFEEYNEEWLDFVAGCKNGGIHDYDVVEGFTTNDEIYEDIDAYLSGNIDKVAYLKLIKEECNKRQISFHNARALSKVVFLGSHTLK